MFSLNFCGLYVSACVWVVCRFALNSRQWVCAWSEEVLKLCRKPRFLDYAVDGKTLVKVCDDTRSSELTCPGLKRTSKGGGWHLDFTD